MLDSTIQTDVIIIGAGPTGLSLAVQLMRYGINFVIFDSKEGVTDLSKALVVHAWTLEIYDPVGLAKPAIAAGEPVRRGALLHKGKINARMDFSDFGGRLSHLLRSTDQFFDVAASDHWYFRFLLDNILPTLAGTVTRFQVAKEFVFSLLSQIGLNYQVEFSQPASRRS